MINYNVPDVLVQISHTHCEGAFLHIKMKQNIYPLFSLGRITYQYFVICIRKACTQNWEPWVQVTNFSKWNWVYCYQGHDEPYILLVYFCCFPYTFLMAATTYIVQNKLMNVNNWEWNKIIRKWTKLQFLATILKRLGIT